MTTHNDDGTVIESVVLSQESGNYGVDIPKNVWHKQESLEENSVIFECKEDRSCRMSWRDIGSEE